MTYKDIDRDMLIRKRRIAFELGESNLPKYVKKFIERVLDSEELTPTISEAEIRADARRKFAEVLKEKIETDVVHFKPKYMQTMIDAMLSDFCDCVDEILAEYEKEQK